MRIQHLIPFLALLLSLTSFRIDAQEADRPDSFGPGGPEVVYFNGIQENGDLYFKVTLQGLKKDTYLILEKKMPGRQEPIVVDTQHGVGSSDAPPLLYCFKDEDVSAKASLYRIRGTQLDEDGEDKSWVIAEKRFHDRLLSSKED